MSGTFPDIGDLPISYVDPKTLKPHPQNARARDQKALDALHASIARWGWKFPLIVNRRSPGYCLDGHGRLTVALQRKDKRVPVTYLDLDEHEEREFLASWNRTAELSEWDDVKLASLFKLTMEDGAPPPASWDAEEVGTLLLALAASGEDAPPKQKSSRAKPPVTCPDCGLSFYP